MTLTKYGIREWGIATAIALALTVFAWPSPWLMTLIGIFWIGVAGFFRDPRLRRPATTASNDLVSPADGVVSAVFDVDQHDAIGGPATIVRIFLSVLDVHINRSPCDGSVVSITHTPGKYLDARTEESARVNESNLIVIRRNEGGSIGVRQVSGAIARRIVCPLESGALLKRGQRFGMIKFGSTTELIVPRETAERIHVAKGDRVKGGVTILVTLRR